MRRAPAQEPGLSDGQYAALRRDLLPLLLAHQGHLNPLPGKQAAKAVHHTHDRLVRKCYRRLIKDGWLILSSTREPGGYFLATSMEEVDVYLRSLGSRIEEDVERWRDIKRLADEKFGGVCQLDLPWIAPP